MAPPAPTTGSIAFTGQNIAKLLGLAAALAGMGVIVIRTQRRRKGQHFRR
jgi:hypothetical protein